MTLLMEEVPPVTVEMLSERSTNHPDDLNETRVIDLEDGPYRLARVEAAIENLLFPTFLEPDGRQVIGRSDYLLGKRDRAHWIEDRLIGKMNFRLYLQIPMHLQRVLLRYQMIDQQNPEQEWDYIVGKEIAEKARLDEIERRGERIPLIPFVERNAPQAFAEADSVLEAAVEARQEAAHTLDRAARLGELAESAEESMDAELLLAEHSIRRLHEARQSERIAQTVASNNAFIHNMSRTLNPFGFRWRYSEDEGIEGAAEVNAQYDAMEVDDAAYFAEQAELREQLRLLDGGSPRIELDGLRAGYTRAEWGAMSLVQRHRAKVLARVGQRKPPLIARGPIGRQLQRGEKAFDQLERRDPVKAAVRLASVALAFTLPLSALLIYEGNQFGKYISDRFAEYVMGPPKHKKPPLNLGPVYRVPTEWQQLFERPPQPKHLRQNQSPISHVPYVK
ncbi:MAG TPA: hypothetical protein VGS28_04580 [Candidatus Saccharimonadales bacterium]|nr:hypothetical protein [Candidatus Saccharimonadales bacterium]